jgi:hypothetical protein
LLWLPLPWLVGRQAMHAFVLGVQRLFNLAKHAGRQCRRTFLLSRRLPALGFGRGGRTHFEFVDDNCHNAVLPLSDLQARRIQIDQLAGFEQPRILNAVC